MWKIFLVLDNLNIFLLKNIFQRLRPGDQRGCVHGDEALPAAADAGGGGAAAGGGDPAGAASAADQAAAPLQGAGQRCSSQGAAAAGGGGTTRTLTPCTLSLRRYRAWDVLMCSVGRIGRNKECCAY